MLMLRVTGIFLVVLGIIWTLQGLGVLTWPTGSFMLGERNWAVRGIGTAAAGAVLLGLLEWRRRR
jgi:hypothetical protein